MYKKGLWGYLVLILSILFIISGFMINSLYGFDGQFIANQGIIINLESAKIYNRINSKPGKLNLSKLAMSLISSELKYGQGKNTDFITKIEFHEDENWLGQFIVKKDKPFEYEGIKISIEDYGYSPFLWVQNKQTGKADYYNSLNIKKLADQRQYSIKPANGKNMYIKFFPDFYKQGNSVGTRSQSPKNPVIQVTAGEEKGWLPLKKDLQINNTNIKFNDLNYWIRFRVIKQPGDVLLKTGIILALAGMVLSFVLLKIPKKSVNSTK